MRIRVLDAAVERCLWRYGLSRLRCDRLEFIRLKLLQQDVSGHGIIEAFGRG